jgi:hypothetical protein
VQLEISDLEPLAGAGFAMCLAYLALDRFRYRTEIERAANAALGTLDKEGDGTPDPPPSLENNDQVLELKWLARKNCNGFKPNHPWLWAYSVAFRNEVDVFVAAVLAFASASVLTFGVALKIKRWPFAAEFNIEPWIGRSFYICLAAVIGPPIAVWFGRKIMQWSTGRCKHLDEQIAAILKLRVPDTQAPVLPDTILPPRQPKTTRKG